MARIIWSDDDLNDPDFPATTKAFIATLERLGFGVCGGDFADEHALSDADIERLIRSAAREAEDWETAYGPMDPAKIEARRIHYENGYHLVIHPR